MANEQSERVFLVVYKGETGHCRHDDVVLEHGKPVNVTSPFNARRMIKRYPGWFEEHADYPLPAPHGWELPVAEQTDLAHTRERETPETVVPDPPAAVTADEEQESED